MNTIDVIMDYLYTAKSIYENSIELSDRITQLVESKNELIYSLIACLDTVVKSQTQEHVMNFLKGKASLNTSVLRILATAPKILPYEKKEHCRETKPQRTPVYEINKMNNRLYSAKNCVDALRAAADYYGSWFTVIQYENYREDELKARNDKRLPSSRTIVKNLGYWKAAICVIHNNSNREWG